MCVGPLGSLDCHSGWMQFAFTHSPSPANPLSLSHTSSVSLSDRSLSTPISLWTWCACFLFLHIPLVPQPTADQSHIVLDVHDSLTYWSYLTTSGRGRLLCMSFLRPTLSSNKTLLHLLIWSVLSDRRLLCVPESWFIYGIVLQPLLNGLILVHWLIVSWMNRSDKAWTQTAKIPVSVWQSANFSSKTNISAPPTGEYISEPLKMISLLRSK